MRRPKEKLERSLGMKLFLKAERCSSPKCVTVRRPTRPGIHGKKPRRSVSEYGRQLLEKQKIKAYYGLKEKSLERIVKKAMTKTDSANSLIVFLEHQLSNVVFNLGLAPSRIVAKQLINHGHFLVNGKKVITPSSTVKIGDIISIKPSSRTLLIFEDLPNKLKKYETPEWLTLDKEKLEGRIKSSPTIFESLFDINLIIDYYSK